MVSKPPCIINPHLVECIQISTPSFLKNIKLVYFHLIISNVLNCFGFFKILFRSMSFKRNIKKKNACPIKLIDSCIKNFLNKRLTEKPVTLTAEKKDVVIVLLFLDNI